MEINKLVDALGVLTAEAITEGRMVLLTSHDQSYDYGSREDLPAVKLPDTSVEATKARYCLVFAQSDSKPPLYEPYPTVPNGSARYGFDGNSNVPFSAKVHLTYPGMKEGEIIPSGVPAVAHSRGIYTVPSGAWIFNSSIKAGTPLAVADTSNDGASEAGKLKFSASVSFVECIEVDDDKNLTFRILY